MITINSCFSKLFALLLNNRLKNFINKEDALKFNQIGFSKGFRTADHVLTLKTLIDKYLDRNQNLYICFVDFSKAYDSIWRKYLFHKLSTYGIHKNFISLLEDMYMKSKLSISLPSGTTHFFPSSAGLKQGCNLSPIIFNLLINDIGDIFDQDQCQPPSILKLSLNHLLYADDLVLISEQKLAYNNA